MSECTYCGSDVQAHDPVYVATDGPDGCEAVGRFCNYACLSAWIDEGDRTEGAACEWEP